MIILVLTKYCCNCGGSLGLERIISENLGGDGSIDYCLECINKATAGILQKWTNQVKDSDIRDALKSKLSEFKINSNSNSN